jgi:hypothetical protein
MPRPFSGLEPVVINPARLARIVSEHVPTAVAVLHAFGCFDADQVKATGDH